MHSLEQTYLERIKFGQAELGTLRALGELQGKQGLFTKQSPEILKSLQQVAIVESSESSNRLKPDVALRQIMFAKLLGGK